MKGNGSKLLLLAVLVVLYVLVKVLPHVNWSTKVTSDPITTEVFGLPAKGVATSVAGLIGTLVLLVSWLKVGIDPRRGVVYPRFELPEEIGPAEARYIHQRGADDRCFAAAIVSMSVKGALRIVEQPSSNPLWAHEFRLEPLGWSDRGLTLSERVAYWALFPASNSLTLRGSRADRKRVDRARERFFEQLWADYHGRKFVDNLSYTLVALGISATIAALLLFLITGDLKSTYGQFVIWFFATMCVPFYTAVAAFLWASRHHLLRDGKALMSILVFVGSVCVALPYFLYNALQSDLSDPRSDIDLLMLGSGIVFGAFVTLFHFLIATPTKKGRRLIDRLEGFALYLRTAEEDRLDILHPLEGTSEPADKLLPYVIALGDRHAWGKEFVAALTATSAPD